MDALEKLKKEYIESLPQKRDALAITIHFLLKDIKEDKEPNFTNLIEISHKVAGSSGTYGFKDLSSHARELEQKVEAEFFDGKSKKEAAFYLESWLKKLDVIFKNIYQAEKQKKAA